MKWQKEIRNLENVEDRKIKVFERITEVPIVHKTFMVLVLRHGQGQRLRLPPLVHSHGVNEL